MQAFFDAVGDALGGFAGAGGDDGEGRDEG